MAQQTTYTYNYEYNWQTTQGTGAPAGPPQGTPPQGETRTSNEDGSQTTTVTGGFSATTTTETEPTEAQSSPSGSIGAGFDHTYLRSIEGILRLISIVSLGIIMVNV